MIAAIYARKSTEDTRSKEEGKSTARQIENATAYAVANGWTIDPDLIFVDENISGGEFVNRPGLAACRAAAAAHRFERLVVMERSRIGRATWRTGACIEELEEAGVEVHAYGGQGIIRSGSVDTVVGVWSDTEEKARASHRTREGLTAKAQQGHATGGRPYGYVVVRKDRHSEYQIDPEQAAIVRQAFQWSASGLGDARVRNRLADLTGSPWRRNRVRRLLSNPIYIGELAWGRTRVTPRGGQAKRRVRTAEPAVLVERPELRIIEDALWNQVQARKAATRAHYAKGGLATKPAGGTATKYLLTGILRCGTCNSTMTMLGGNGRRYYCLGRAQKGAAFCSNRASVPMDILDKAVIDILLDELLGDPERLWAIIREREADGPRGQHGPRDREAGEGDRQPGEAGCQWLPGRPGRHPGAPWADRAAAGQGEGGTRARDEGVGGEGLRGVQDEDQPEEPPGGSRPAGSPGLRPHHRE